MDKEFSNQAREILNAKMDNYGENRGAIITDMKDKLKVKKMTFLLEWNRIYNICLVQTQFQEIEKTRETLEQQKSIGRVAIDTKLKTAASVRDENIRKMLERLKEHVCHILYAYSEINE